MDFLSHVLMVLALLACAIVNGWFGFLGIVVGGYRMKPEQGLQQTYNAKKLEFWNAHAHGDASTLVCALLFVHVGLILFLLILFGPKGQEKDTKSRFVLK